MSQRPDNGNITLEGKTWKDVRYTATLSFEIPETAAGGADGAK
jgi:hypothetical protein